MAAGGCTSKAAEDGVCSAGFGCGGLHGEPASRPHAAGGNANHSVVLISAEADLHDVRDLLRQFPPRVQPPCVAHLRLLRGCAAAGFDARQERWPEHAAARSLWHF